MEIANEWKIAANHDPITSPWIIRVEFEVDQVAHCTTALLRVLRILLINSK
jgi:hypothetical protein